MWYNSYTAFKQPLSKELLWATNGKPEILSSIFFQTSGNGRASIVS